MGSKICMNEYCRATTSPEWKRGWAVSSGVFGRLCYNCGLAFENLIFCETFHLKESGWRECKHCGKPIHCGCIASKFLHDYLENGGIGCLRCITDLETQMIRPIQSKLPTQKAEDPTKIDTSDQNGGRNKRARISQDGHNSQE